MAFRRRIFPTSMLEGPALDAAMVGIGMLFTAKANPNANIEDTVLAASITGMEEEDLRVLSVLVTWLGIHHERLNADRLVRLVIMRCVSRKRAMIYAKWKVTGATVARSRDSSQCACTTW